jgi:tetratricopeptide (TPR) repeat protein
MTLVLTVVSPKVIYQSADYRLTDMTTGETRDFDTQKVFIVNTFRWSATIGFAGVGSTRNVDVATWVAEAIAAVNHDDPIENLLDSLLAADQWLAPLPPHGRRHSFSVAAFIGSQPNFFLISNFESLDGRRSSQAQGKLQLQKHSPRQARAFTSGQPVPRPERRMLARLVARDPAEPARVYDALAGVNRQIAKTNKFVSPGCFTAHVRLTGEGGGTRHGEGGRPELVMPALPEELRRAVDQLIAQQFPGGAQIQSITTGRADASDDYHRTQLLAKPLDPNVHSNYGVFLLEFKRDPGGAERAYRRALELDERHVNALGNLANLLWDRGGNDEARELYERALKIDSAAALVRTNFARFTLRVDDDPVAAEALVVAGLDHAPTDEGLLELGGLLAFMRKDAACALSRYETLRRSRGGQEEVERGYAIALHMTGSPVAECISAYRVALAVDQTKQEGYAACLLNLAQLLFTVGADAEAEKRLAEALASGLDPASRLEAEFYQLAHTERPANQVLQTIRSLLDSGARTDWNLEPNIAHIAEARPDDATTLRIVADAMAGRKPPEVLDDLMTSES